jgi:hypothetical protein
MQRSDEEALVHAFVGRFPELTGLLEAHLEDNFGELLPHLFMGDVTRAVVATWAGSPDAPPGLALQQLFSYLEERYRTGTENETELLEVSFVENLPRPDESNYDIRQMLGPGHGGAVRLHHWTYRGLARPTERRALRRQPVHGPLQRHDVHPPEPVLPEAGHLLHAEAEWAIVGRSGAAEPGGAELRRAEVSVHVAAGERGKSAIADHVAAGDRADPALVEPLEDGLDVARGLTGLHPPGALEHAPAEVRARGTASGNEIDLLDVALPHVRDGEVAASAVERQR